MTDHNICFKEVILKIIPKMSYLPVLIWSTEEWFAMHQIQDRHSNIDSVVFPLVGT